MSGRPETGAVVLEERQRAITAAWVVLARSGFDGFKVQLVLRESGLSARGFYRHFEGKAELLVALMQEEMARSAAIIAAAVSRSAPPADRVEIWIRSIVGAAGSPDRAARARLFTAQASVVRRFPDLIASAAGVLLEPLTSALRDGSADGSLPAADAERDSKVIYALAGSLMTSCLDDPDRYPLEEVTAHAVAFTLRSLGATSRQPSRQGVI